MGACSETALEHFIVRNPSEVMAVVSDSALDFPLSPE